jgi:hypothetical protein
MRIADAVCLAIIVSFPFLLQLPDFVASVRLLMPAPRGRSWTMERASAVVAILDRFPSDFKPRSRRRAPAWLFPFGRLPCYENGDLI